MGTGKTAPQFVTILDVAALIENEHKRLPGEP